MTHFKPLMFTLLVSVCVGCSLLHRGPSRPLFWGSAIEGPASQTILLRHASATGMRPQIVGIYLQWTSDFDADSVKAIWDYGALPCVTWEPTHITDGHSEAVTIAEVISGRYDSYLASFALAVKKWGKPLILRFAHEMNLREYHWTGSEDEYGEHTPGRYVQMYRYVVDLFRKHGATNILWAFCPNADSVPHAPDWNVLQHYYPGDDYIDILGVDGYNWGDSVAWSHWRSFEEIFSKAFKELRDIAPTKPLFVFETASVGDEIAKNAWLKKAIHICKEWGVEALIWFDINKENDWRIQVDPAIKSSFTGQPAAQQWALELKS